jgi:hypothetical protein
MRQQRAGSKLVVTCCNPSGGVSQLQLGGVGHMQRKSRAACQAGKDLTHNVAADGVELQIQFGSGSESAIAHETRRQPP